MRKSHGRHLDVDARCLRHEPDRRRLQMVGCGRIGPRELDPFAVGLICWGTLMVLTLCLALFFAEKRG